MTAIARQDVYSWRKFSETVHLEGFQKSTVKLRKAEGLAVQLCDLALVPTHSVVSFDFIRNTRIECSKTRSIEQIPQGNERQGQIHGHQQHSC
jgi:hypothetical protein